MPGGGTVSNREIKQRSLGLTVMIVTAYGDERRRRAREPGAAGISRRAVDFDQLKTQLRHLPSAAD